MRRYFFARISWCAGEERTVNNQPTLAVRINADNRKHHLWNNNGTWFIHYTVYPDRLTKARVRRSLQTKHLKTALEQRDRLLARWENKTGR
ncbi:MAG: hypothetical protein V2A34_05320 [Lentisphaerota bacterium]